MLLSLNPLKIYLYREGLARFATENYEQPSKKNANNMCIHLTNYAINKKNSNFISNKNLNTDNEGHKRSFSSILTVKIFRIIFEYSYFNSKDMM